MDSALLAAFGAEELATGIMPDLPGGNPRFFRNGRNVQFSNGAVQPLLRQATLIQPQDDGPNSGLLDALISGTPRLFWGTPSLLYSWTAATRAVVEGTGYTGGDTTLWSLVKWGNWVVATNGVNSLQSWRGAGFSHLPAGAPARAKLLVVRDPYLLALNTDMGGEFIEWCHRDDIDLWTPAVSNEAGNLPVRNLASEFRAAVPYRGEVVAATSGELVFVRYVGPPYFFGATRIAPGAGVWGPYSLCVAQGALYGIGPRGIWRSDGQSAQYFDEPLVREFVYENINEAQAFRSLAWFNTVDNIIEFHYPCAGAPYNDKGVAYNPDSGAWTILGDGRSSATDNGVFNFSILTDETGEIYYITPLEPTYRPGYLSLSPLALIDIGYGESGFGEGGFAGEELDG